MENRQFSNALTLAPDQNSRHVVSPVPRFCQRGIRPMPTRVVGVMSCGTAFAMVALPATGSVQDDFVRSSQPVLVDEKIDYVGGALAGFAITPASVAIFCSLARVSRRIGRSGRR